MADHKEQWRLDRRESARRLARERRRIHDVAPVRMRAESVSLREQFDPADWRAQ